MTNMRIDYKVVKEEKVLDILKNKLNISKRLLKKIKDDYIYINNLKCKHYEMASPGDVISVDLGYQEENENIVPNNQINLEIIYEDNWILIVNKPKNMPTHPAIGHFEDSLSNCVKSYFEKIRLKKKIRPVNRLDRDTTGIVIFAKCEYIQELLIEEMKKDKFKKNYIAICKGKFLNKIGKVDKPIARKEGSIIERCISENGKEAVTKYKVINEKEENSIIECELETGRTHQIRVHMSSIGHPLIGDELYGEKSELIDRQALHCNRIEFVHPITKKIIEINCKLPEDMKKI